VRAPCEAPPATGRIWQLSFARHFADVPGCNFDSVLSRPTTLFGCCCKTGKPAAQKMLFSKVTHRA